jgi:glycosyltransferase involved in cell wall biosynthesis
MKTGAGRSTLRVLFVVPLYEPACSGGAVTSMVGLCRALVQLGHRVTVFTTNSDGRSHMAVATDQAVEVGGVDVFYFHTPLPRKFRYSSVLSLACKRSVRGFDIVHIASTWDHPGISAAREANRAGVPYVISLQGTLIPAALLSKRVRKWLYLKMFGERIIRNGAAIHYTSLLERSKTQSLKIRKPNFVIPHGVDLSGLAGRVSRTEARRRLQLGEGDFAVGFLGRLHWIKALDVLVAAIQRVIRAGHMCVKLFLVGPDDGAEHQLRQLVDEMGLARHVRFLGPLYDAHKLNYLSALDVFALVSWTENFGNVAVEAMSVGVPVLVSEHAGVCDDVSSSGSGWVVPVDAGAIAATLIQIVQAPEERQECGRNAARCAFDRFESGRVAQLMAIAYRDIISGSRSTECMWDCTCPTARGMSRSDLQSL